MEEEEEENITTLNNSGIEIKTIHLTTSDELCCEDFYIRNNDVKKELNKWFEDFKYIGLKYNLVATYLEPLGMIYDKNNIYNLPAVKKVQKGLNIEEYGITSEHLTKFFDYFYVYSKEEHEGNVFKRPLFDFIRVEFPQKEQSIRRDKKENDLYGKYNVRYCINVECFKSYEHYLFEKEYKIKADINTFPIDYNFLISTLKILFFCKLYFILQFNVIYNQSLPKYNQNTGEKEKEFLQPDELFKIASYKINNAVIQHIALFDTLTSSQYLYEDYFYELNQLNLKAGGHIKSNPERQSLTFRYNNLTAPQYNYKPNKSTCIELFINKDHEGSDNNIKILLQIFGTENIKEILSLTNTKVKTILPILYDKNFFPEKFNKFVFNKMLLFAKEYKNNFSSIKKPTFSCDLKFIRDNKLNKKGGKNNIEKTILAIMQEKLDNETFTKVINNKFTKRHIKNKKKA